MTPIIHSPHPWFTGVGAICTNGLIGTGTSAAGGGEAHNNKPAYYETIFVMRIS